MDATINVSGKPYRLAKATLAEMKRIRALGAGTEGMTAEKSDVMVAGILAIILASICRAQPDNGLTVELLEESFTADDLGAALLKLMEISWP